MAKKHTPEEIAAKLRQVDVLPSQGMPIGDAIRSVGVTEVTYYRWRNEYGGLKSNQRLPSSSGTAMSASAPNPKSRDMSSTPA